LNKKIVMTDKTGIMIIKSVTTNVFSRISVAAAGDSLIIRLNVNFIRYPDLSIKVIILPLRNKNDNIAVNAKYKD